jgi:hypothetical protein
MNITLLPDYTPFMINVNADNSISSYFIRQDLIQLLWRTFGTECYFALRCYNGNLYAVVNDKDVYLISIE